jgi:hypothetical protein
MPLVRLTVATLAAALLLSVSAFALVGGFEGSDGDQDADCATSTKDWRCLDDAQTIHLPDGSGAGDDVFSGGSKENEPDTWVYETGDSQDKTDVQAAWLAATRGPANTTYLNAAFRIASGNGNKFVGIELNQSTARWTNSLGALVPCRTDGDVLLSYAFDNPAVVSAYEWDGSGGPGACPDGRTGSWTGPVAVPGLEAAVNAGGSIVNFLDAGVHGARSAPPSRSATASWRRSSPGPAARAPSAS